MANQKTLENIISRRNFIGKLALGAAGIAISPKALAIEEIKTASLDNLDRQYLLTPAQANKDTYNNLWISAVQTTLAHHGHHTTRTSMFNISQNENLKENPAYILQAYMNGLTWTDVNGKKFEPQATIFNKEYLGETNFFEALYQETAHDHPVILLNNDIAYKNYPVVLEELTIRGKKPENVKVFDPLRSRGPTNVYSAEQTISRQDMILTEDEIRNLYEAVAINVK